MRLLRKRFGPISETLAAQISPISSEERNELEEALFDFSSLAYLEQWLTRH